jgi:hypothetical protein
MFRFIMLFVLDSGRVDGRRNSLPAYNCRVTKEMHLLNTIIDRWRLKPQEGMTIRRAVGFENLTNAQEIILDLRIGSSTQ